MDRPHNADGPHEGSRLQSTTWTDPTRVKSLNKSIKWTNPTKGQKSEPVKWMDPTRVKTPVHNVDGLNKGQKLK